MEEAIETIEKEDGYVIEIHTDDNPENPREWDNACRMVCYHPHYTLGDNKKVNRDTDWNELWDEIKQEEKPVVAAMLYLLDHSGLWIKHGTIFEPSKVDPHKERGVFWEDSAGWDTSAVGLIYMPEKTFKENSFTLEQARRSLSAEVQEYSDYLSGYVYGYVVLDPEGETVSSCFGFYGEQGRKDALESAEAELEAARKGSEETDAFVRNHFAL